ncbi:hypothetical protein HMPREF9946_04498 [Acetobacteraceae bacterium AT-5844]|nr:hypothetical protein HMPREF9946_04498 [Acetobacteraceae bacterium AT-5844]
MQSPHVPTLRARIPPPQRAPRAIGAGFVTLWAVPPVRDLLYRHGPEEMP